MAPAKPVDLATRGFTTQGKAIEFFKKMLNRYALSERVTKEDAFDLASLLERHPEYASKVGCGIDHFEIILTEHGTRCFRLVRIDGTGTDFSYRRCISGKAPSRKQEVSQAFRRAVRFDIYRARDSFFATNGSSNATITCAVTDEHITREQSHIDHMPPMTFEVIVTSFLASNGLSVDNVPLSTGVDDQVAPEITDETLKESFRAYHQSVATLDIVKSSINLAQASRNRLKQGRVTIPRPLE